MGVEIKDKVYLGCIIPSPSPLIQHVGDKLEGWFKEHKYRGLYSNEIRVTDEPYSKDFKGKPYFIDPTCRAPSPPSEVFCMMYQDHCLARAVWDMAHFKMPVLTPKYRWGAQIVLKSEWHDKHQLHVKFPPSIKPWLKLKNFCVDEGEYWCIPHGNGGYFGSVIGVGNSPQEAWGMAYRNYEKVEAQEKDERNECLFEKAMRQFKVMRSYGML